MAPDWEKPKEKFKKWWDKLVTQNLNKVRNAHDDAPAPEKVSLFGRFAALILAVVGVVSCGSIILAWVAFYAIVYYVVSIAIFIGQIGGVFN